MARAPRLVLAAGLLCALLVAAAPAQAVVPPAATVSTRVETQPGGSALGDLTFRTTFSDPTATATATPSPLRLALGSLYRIRTCVWTKAPGEAPASDCRELETRPNAVTVVTGVSAPVAAMTVERPAAGRPPATIAGEVLVDLHKADGTYAPIASSWPAGGLPEAGIAVPAVDQVAGPVLGPQGVVFPGIRGGGINSGTQDSICREDQRTPNTPPAGSTDVLGSLPFAYEVGEPPAGRPVRGVMIILHGGAWFSVGEAKLRFLRDDAERWRARGWRSVNATYRPCGTSVDDVLRLYDRVRTRYGAATPVCAFGRSAGGHLSLLLAARRPKLACVVSVAGIADLSKLAGATTPTGSSGPSTVANWATAAFGADRLTQLSTTGSAVKARVLYAIAATDTLVPYEQATAFAADQRRRDPGAYVDTLQVPAGDAPFEHGPVSPAGLEEFYAREQQLVAPLVIGDVVAPSRVRLNVLRANGLRARFTCAGRCTVSGRLELTAATARRLGLARVVGRGTARRASRGGGLLTVRLTNAAKRRIAVVGARLVSSVTVAGERRRQTARITLRRP